MKRLVSLEKEEMQIIKAALLAMQSQLKSDANNVQSANGKFAIEYTNFVASNALKEIIDTLEKY